MNVGDLRRAIIGLPDDMPVVTEDSERGWEEDVSAYLVPAHIEHHTYGNRVADGPARNDPNWIWQETDCRVLLISEFGQSHHDGVVDLAPEQDRPTVIDAERELREL